MEQRGVMQHGPDKVVHHSRTEHVRVVQLAFVLRLIALNVERWIDRIGIGWLTPAVEFHPAEDLILVAEIVIHTAAEQPFPVTVRHRYSVGRQARSRKNRV